MDYRGTRYFFLEDYFVNEISNKDSKYLYERCSQRFSEYLRQADYPMNKEIEAHVTTSILPLIAVYKVLQEEGMSKKEAYDHCLAISKIYALSKRASNERLGRNPLGFLLFKLFCKKVMDKGFPKEGWKVVWKERSFKRIAFEMHSCIYCEMTKAFGCSELCSVFCQNDIITFAGFEPTIYFRRKGTLAEGNPICDFTFFNGKKVSK